MKIAFRIFFITAIMCVMAACSNESSPYNPGKSERLKAMIESKENLSEGDYNEMIDQILGGIQVINDKNKEIGDNQNKKREFLMKDKNQKMVENILEFTFYLEQHRDELSPSTEKRMLEAQKELMKLRD